MTSTGPSPPIAQRLEYRIFPPRWKNIYVPDSSRGAALAAMKMWSPCRRAGITLQRAGLAAVTMLGVRVLGGTAAWVPPTGWSTWARLEEVWRGTVGDFNSVGLYQRPQATRSGLAALLINDERPVAFVRLRYLDDDQTMAHLRREHDVLTALDDAKVSAFEHPHPMAIDTIDDWGYLLTSAVGGLDRPAARGPVQAITDDIVTGLAGLTRPADVSPGWVPMHGDLTPWNLRRRSDGTITLVDWEDADWGPLAADAVMLHASRQALFGVTPPPMPVEAVAFWRQRILQRPRNLVDERIRADLLAALDLMATEAGPSGLAWSAQV